MTYTYYPGHRINTTLLADNITTQITGLQYINHDDASLKVCFDRELPPEEETLLNSLVDQA